MTDLEIFATQSTPAIHSRSEQGLLRICGESYPENPFALYDPVIQWVEDYLRDKHQPLLLELQLTYLNTSSIKAVMELLDLLQEAHVREGKVAVHWKFSQRNGRAGEMGEDFREEYTFPFVIVPVDETQP